MLILLLKKLRLGEIYLLPLDIFINQWKARNYLKISLAQYSFKNDFHIY